MKLRYLYLSGLGLAIITAVLGILTVCSKIGSDSPKAVVIKLFGAMEKNRTQDIPLLVDLPALMKIRDQDYALQTDKPRIFYAPEDILRDLTGDGLTKQRWFAMQRIVGNTDVAGDTAFVEVSFIDKSTNTQYYNKFGLRKLHGRWKIYSFKTISPSK
ncbi:MAG: hypothetical protein NTV06_09310 [candidate division Zixibacteria bacterium]|nr:hypothetical protein [candidate division Zixibacteria bacterium]